MQQADPNVHERLQGALFLDQAGTDGSGGEGLAVLEKGPRESKRKVSLEH